MDDKQKNEFKKLLEYQEKDKQLRLINKAINSDKNLAIKNEQEQLFNAAKQKLADCEEKASKIIANFNGLKSYVDEIESLLNEAKKAVDNDLPEEQLIEEVKKLDALVSKTVNADKRTTDVEKQIPSLAKTRSEAIKDGNNAKAQYKQAKDGHEKLKSERAGDIEKLQKEIDGLRSGIDKRYLEKYDELNASGKYPAVVQAAQGIKKGQYSCGGCGMGLSQQANGEIEKEGWCRCNTCGRIIVDMIELEKKK